MSLFSLNTAKTSYSYTTQFVGNTADPCFTKGNLNGSANIFITGNSLFFDYSEVKTGNDLKFLNKFFNGLTTGSTFNFSSGVYYNDATSSSINWNGTLQLQGISGTFKQYISCSGVTGTAALTGGYYVSKNFTNPIQFTATTGNTANILISNTPRSSPLNFDFFGVYGSDYGFEEYVEVIGSTLNSGRLKIKNYVKLNDNTEVIYLTNPVTNENRFFNKSQVDILHRGLPSLAVLATNPLQNGVIKIAGATSGIVSMLLENQNILQHALRQQLDTANVYYYYPNSTLKTINANTESIVDYKNISISYSNIFILKIKTSYFISFNTDGFNISEFLGTNQYNDLIYIDNIETETLSINSNTAVAPIKIDLSDAENKSAVINVFLDSNCTQPLIENYYLLGEPGYEGASFIYMVDRAYSSKTIFMQIKKNTTNVLRINIA
jgi:hypothetical protein